MSVDLRGLSPAPVTPFTADGDVDHAALSRLGRWLAGIEGVKSLVCLGHAGEGTFLTAEEQEAVIRTLVEAVDGRVAIVAGITGEGTKVAALEAQRAVAAGADAGLVYPNHGWLRFGFQAGAPQDRYRELYEESGLPLILFQYPDATKASYDLETQLEIAAQPGVFATKNGVRNMRRWDTEIPVLRAEQPDLQILTCHDEYLLHTMFDVDGALVGYGGLAPEPLVELIAAGKARDYPKARAIHDRLLPVTKAVYHRGSHMEGTVALKLGLVARGILERATVRSPLFVIIAAAAALGQAGEEGATLGDLADVLEPVAGSFGSTIFALGFFGAAFSSMIANASAGATLASDGLGWGNKLDTRRVKLLILTILAFGAAVTAIASAPPVQLIVIAQALTVLVAPLLGVLLVVLANNRQLMGPWRNRGWQNLVSALGLVAILATCVRLITTL